MCGTVVQCAGLVVQYVRIVVQYAGLVVQYVRIVVQYAGLHGGAVCGTGDGIRSLLVSQ